MGVCLVTGSSRGFGRLICEHLAARGHRVYAGMRDPAGRGAELAETCELVRLDVTDEQTVNRVVGEIADREGRLDAVVNNAGYVVWGPVEETPIDAIERELDVNLFGGLRVIRAALPVMRRQGSGVIVQMSSISGRIVAGPLWGHYAASKHALEALSEALAYEVRPFGIRVVLIEPGSYDTTIGESIELSPGLAEGESAYAETHLRMDAAGEPWELGDPNDVAQAVVGAIEDDTTPLRVLLGIDAAWYVESKSRGDDEYRRAIWRLWQLPE